MLRLLLMGVLLMMPIAGAQVGIDVREWTYHIIESEGNNNGAIAPTNFTISRPHQWDIMDNNTTLIVNANYMILADLTQSIENLYQVVVDNVVYAECAWRIRTLVATGEEAVTLRARNINMRCAIEYLTPGEHTIEIRRTNTQGGLDNVLRASTSITAIQTEGIQMENEIIQAVNEFGIILAMTALIIWAERTREWLLWALVIVAAGYEILRVAPNFFAYHTLVLAAGLFALVSAYTDYKETGVELEP